MFTAMSTSPFWSAATRTASSGMGLKTSRLIRGTPRQYCSLASSSMRSSFTHRTNFEGPRAHGILLQVGHLLFPVVPGRKHGGLTGGQHGGQEWPAGLAVHTHGEGVDNLNVTQRREGRRPAQLEPGIDEPLEAELHCFGLEGLA